MASVNPEQIIIESDDDNKIDEADNFLTSQREFVPPTMGSEETRKIKKSQTKHQPQSLFFQHLTTATHACVLLYLLLIVYFCVFNDFVFFTWHPLLMSIGWLFLMTEATLALSKDNILTGTLPKLIRRRLHWIFQTLAVTLTLIGFLVVYINKNNLNKQHFKTWHGLLGLIAIISSLPTCLNGVAALFHANLRQYIKPKFVKFVHVASGLTAFIFGGLSLILSVYTNWFARHSNHNVITFILGLALVSVAVIWTLLRPLVKCCNQLMHLF